MKPTQVSATLKLLYCGCEFVINLLMIVNIGKGNSKASEQDLINAAILMEETLKSKLTCPAHGLLTAQVCDLWYNLFEVTVPQKRSSVSD